MVVKWNEAPSVSTTGVATTAVAATTHATENGQENNDRNKKGLSAGGVAGVVIGCLIGVAIIAVLAFFFVSSRRGKKEESGHMSVELGIYNKSEPDADTYLQNIEIQNEIGAGEKAFFFERKKWGGGEEGERSRDRTGDG